MCKRRILNIDILGPTCCPADRQAHGGENITPTAEINITFVSL